MGMYMLLGGVVLALLAARWAVAVRGTTFQPTPVDPEADAESMDAALRQMGHRGRGGDRDGRACADSLCVPSRLSRPGLCPWRRTRRGVHASHQVA